MSTLRVNLNKEIISLFSGQSSTVTTPKLYVQLTGSLSLAVVLNQCVYWSNKSKCKDGWFYKEYGEWFEEINIPERTLRRRFDRLEQHNWINTKIKKVKGLNTKHIYTNMDLIIESISTMLDTECPNRPLCPDGTDNEQKTCTKVAPTGQSGRLEPATLAGSSIETEDYIQMNTTKLPSSSSFFFSETLDQNILSQKLFRDKRTDEDFMKSVKNHVDNHSDKKFAYVQRAQAALRLVTKMKNENIIFTTSVDLEEKPKYDYSKETDAQRSERLYFQYELEKEKDDVGYLSKALEKYPHMREKYAIT